MNPTDRMRPRQLSEVVGQAAARALERFARAPYPECFLLIGPGGTGKTASAFALAAELGCVDSQGNMAEWTGCFGISSSKLTIERATELFEVQLWRRPLYGNGWKVVVIEEFESVVSDSVRKYLKTALDKEAGNLPPKTVVVATSNKIVGMETWLLQRFEKLSYDSGPAFAQAAQERLGDLWASVFPALDLPGYWLHWGWEGEHFSMRVALREMIRHAGLIHAGLIGGKVAVEV
jgi:DNA polymerase III delta prime subunit